MGIYLRLNQKGITLIELLVALVILGLVVAGIYRVFVAQSKAYTVQDQVVEVQQNVRSAMELLLRDLRMAGFDDDNTPLINVLSPIIPGDHSITVSYEYNGAIRTVVYTVDGSSKLKRNQIPPDSPPIEPDGDPILENVDAFNLTYGVDANDDGVMDDQDANGIINDNDWVAAAGVGTTRVVAVRVRLTARPDQTNQDVQKMVSPRTLESKVTLRNQCLIRFN
jgi:prepilin-type N-terminal cleavage/methylation domain-containing protein